MPAGIYIPRAIKSWLASNRGQTNASVKGLGDEGAKDEDGRLINEIRDIRLIAALSRGTAVLEIEYNALVFAFQLDWLVTSIFLSLFLSFFFFFLNDERTKEAAAELWQRKNFSTRLNCDG